jgi:hypothetical protein
MYKQKSYYNIKSSEIIYHLFQTKSSHTTVMAPHDHVQLHNYSEIEEHPLLLLAAAAAPSSRSIDANA